MIRDSEYSFVSTVVAWYSFVSTVVAWCSVVVFFAIHTFTQSKEIKLQESVNLRLVTNNTMNTKPLVLFICKH